MRRLCLSIAMVLMLGFVVNIDRQARATVITPVTCNCKLHCGDGTWYQIAAGSSGACAAAFATYCGGSGNYSYSSTGYNDCLQSNI